ncbi:uncharacterized protein LAJ45_06002 [Morchella importuna]|uniref:uncharacterized protein n=1 Tax=Morchella importuna TaxID=1174673 RepID=UPI001E8DCBA0|nr:uncharacterized protein LAJ45_06002 [Morchella importuna]KAH8149850.1 hypothetical protein LAJ45_06002 [Morchella importuna]
MARKSNRKNSISGLSFPASSVAKPGTKAISQALKLRRYIDIQLKDVLEESARGNWTEEDERLWQATKPYQCDECKERSSTRYNNNRHKLNKHSIKKITRCPFPGCKLAFSRGDNLVKHQKKHHPEMEQPDEDRNSSPSTEMEEMIARFQLVLPTAPDLPAKSVPELRPYYIPDKLPFLPPQLLSHYSDYYFSSKAFHPYFPLLHKATFKPSSVLASFLRAVCALGGQYDPTNKTLSPQLWESGVKVMERWIERGPGDTDEVDLERPKRNSIGEEGIYRMKVRRDSSYAIPEGMVKPCETISDDEPTDPAKLVLKKHAERKEREERLCVLQGLLLFSIYALFSGEKEKHKKGRNLLARCVEIAREYRYFYEVEKPIPTGSSVQHQWELFVYRESRKRVAFTLFLVDCYMALLFDTPRLLRSMELRNLPLPCDAQLFEAPTCQAWNHLWQTSQLHGSVNVSPPLFGKTLRILLKGRGHSELLQAGGLGSNFSALILAAAIQMEILDITSRLPEEDFDVGAEEPANLSQADYENGRLPEIFPEESRVELQRLRHALNTVGQVSGIANMRLKGCERAFYISMQLALIQIILPDRVTIYQKDVPMDMDTALSNIVDAAKERCYSVTANASTHTSFTRVLEETDLLPHLLGLIRFLGAYQDSARSTEFPVVTVMIFKALMVVWEVLVRIGEGSSGSVGYNMMENVAMYNWAYDPPQTNETWMLMVDDVNWDDLLGSGHQEPPRSLPPVENFRHELLGLLMRWELRNEESEGLESLEWRFLRWMRSLFTDMEHWGVGQAVVNALDGLFEDQDDESETCEDE